MDSTSSQGYHDKLQADLKNDPVSAGSIIEIQTAIAMALWASL